MENQDLKRAGLKVTLPRMKILEILESSNKKHMSAEDIYKVLLDSGDEIGQTDLVNLGTLIGFAKIDGNALFTANVNIGADQIGATAVYSLQIDNTNSQLQTTDGTDIILSLENGIVVGRAAGQPALAISIDPITGDLTVAQYLALSMFCARVRASS